jgi:hypothetical protein
VDIRFRFIELIKVITVTCLLGRQLRDMSRIPLSLDNRLTDSDDFVSLTLR